MAKAGEGQRMIRAVVSDEAYARVMAFVAFENMRDPNASVSTVIDRWGLALPPVLDMVTRAQEAVAEHRRKFVAEAEERDQFQLLGPRRLQRQARS